MTLDTYERDPGKEEEFLNDSMDEGELEEDSVIIGDDLDWAAELIEEHNIYDIEDDMARDSPWSSTMTLAIDADGVVFDDPMSEEDDADEEDDGDEEDLLDQSLSNLGNLVLHDFNDFFARFRMLFNRLRR